MSTQMLPKHWPRIKSPKTSPAKANPSTSRHVIRVEGATEPDSDDESLQGYTLEENSECAPSPIPSELEEIDRDPMLNVGVKEILKPVDLAQLGDS
jgi:hypothetical protein